MGHQSFVEVLESRTLMSAAPFLFDKPVKADRAVVRAELGKFSADIAACNAILTRDRQTMTREGLNSVPGIAPLITQYKTDLTAMRTALKEDRLAESANALADESVIKLDIRQILIDKKNTTAEATDHAKLRADRITLQNDLIAGLDSRIATRMTDEGTVSTDAANIADAVAADTTASAGLVGATGKFSADKTAELAKFMTDLTNIANARATLVADLTAAQST
jgi:hypothetical protein